MLLCHCRVLRRANGFSERRAAAGRRKRHNLETNRGYNEAKRGRDKYIGGGRQRFQSKCPHETRSAVSWDAVAFWAFVRCIAIAAVAVPAC